ncbi:Uncharacterised protein [Legionella busanensis]|uniref:Uncharacterized protein n=1 Tax=Legionella busanensis TaxID=190655 RepID=A0A378JKG7_9GAMM|nr:hypothetical protein [Legionella busanensis]STX51577.1 Uncharacterised protein [Legionella busanensis]
MPNINNLEISKDELLQQNQCLPALSSIALMGGTLIGAIGSLLVTPLTIISGGAVSCASLATACETSLSFFSTTNTRNRQNLVNTITYQPNSTPEM